MKPFLFISFVLLALTVRAQKINFNINGKVEKANSADFAYLTTMSQQVPISSDKLFMVVPIKDGKFDFKGEFDLEGKDYQYACLLIDKRGDITKQEFKSKLTNLIWVIGRNKNLRKIVLEDLSVVVAETDSMAFSKIEKKGLLTLQMDEADTAIIHGNRGLLDFVKKFPDSPVSFYNVKSITSSYSRDRKDRIESIYGLPEELFMSLSKRLKTSKAGLALKKEIDEKGSL